MHVALESVLAAWERTLLERYSEAVAKRRTRSYAAQFAAVPFKTR